MSVQARPLRAAANISTELLRRINDANGTKAKYPNSPYSDAMRTGADMARKLLKRRKLPN
jgi:hypothetical protein